MKKLFLLLLLLLPLIGFAQETGEESPRNFNAILEFLLPAILGQIAVLFADAKKYMFSGIWDWGIFWDTKIKPFLLVAAAAVVVYLVLVFTPYLAPFLEVLTGPIGELTAAGIFAAAQALIDGLFKPTVDPANPVSINNRHNFLRK